MNFKCFALTEVLRFDNASVNCGLVFTSLTGRYNGRWGWGIFWRNMTHGRFLFAAAGGEGMRGFKKRKKKEAFDKE